MRTSRTTSPGLVVTATSANHFGVATGFISSAQRYTAASWRFVFYDIIGDFTEAMRSEVASWCRVEYRLFNATRHGVVINPRVLTNSAWKPLLLLECLVELRAQSGLLIYADASIRFHAVMPPVELKHTLRHSIPVVGLSNNEGEVVARITHPGMVRELADIVGGPSDLQQYMRVPVACGGIHFWSATDWTIQHVMRPWAACAARDSCILPSGASGFNNRAGLPALCRKGLEGHCHRGDMSALSIVLSEAFHVRDHVDHLAEEGWRPPYLRNTTMVGKDNWKKSHARIYGSLISIERFGSNKPAPAKTSDAGGCEEQEFEYSASEPRR